MKDSMGLSPDSRARFNLERASVLILEESNMGMSILVQILTGFGAKVLHRAENVEEAQGLVAKVELDLVVADALGPTGEGYDFVRWLRRSRIEPNCYVPVLLTAGHTPGNAVQKARDCGAHFVMTKPLTPITVLERVRQIGPNKVRVSGMGWEETRDGVGLVVANAGAGAQSITPTRGRAAAGGLRVCYRSETNPRGCSIDQGLAAS